MQNKTKSLYYTIGFIVTRIVAGMIAGLVLALIVASCATPTPVVLNDGPTSKGLTAYDDISHYLDYEASVVCWVYRHYHAGGISCLPLSETNLDAGP